MTRAEANGIFIQAAATWLAQRGPGPAHRYAIPKRDRASASAGQPRRFQNRGGGLMTLAIATGLVMAAASLWIAYDTGNSFPLVPASICIGIALGAALYERATAPTVEPIQD